MSTPATSATYTFGDSDVSARRLELLARSFADSSRDFLARSVSAIPGLAADLGCGPGFSTQFLAETIQCGRVIGLDSSAHFIRMAQSRAIPQVSFCLHDITVVPFPIGQCDLLYSRFVLSHLPRPKAVVSAWATQLVPGGVLLMEETEWIETSNPVFTGYLRVVEAMLADQGARLYVGADLDRMEDTDHLRRRSSRLCHPSISDGEAAELFYLNIQSWKHQSFVRRNYATVAIDRLESDLQALTEESAPESTIRWGLRQLAFERI